MQPVHRMHINDFECVIAIAAHQIPKATIPIVQIK